MDPLNSRPISQQSLFSKVFEKVVLDQTNDFLCLNKFICDYHSCFRKNHSTDTYVLFSNEKILKRFEDDWMTGVILINLQKTFETTNYDILFRKEFIIAFSDDSFSLTAEIENFL